jgi:dTDP-4-amino-4,6-dideoxygalactose transaminase
VQGHSAKTPALRLQRPDLPSAEAIERYLAASRRARWFSNFGPCWQLLRSRLSDAVGRPCVPVANATLGLLVALAVLRRREPGAVEALLPSFAHPAAAQAAVWNGLDPVFVDVGLSHWHLAPAELAAALAERQGRVAAVIALSSFGTPPPPEVRREWERACAAASVPLVIDSAAGYGARAADGLPIGAQGDAEIVSFDAVKPLGAGEGGAIFCREHELAEEMLRLCHFAYDGRRSVARADGINAKMSEPAAAITLAALDGHERTLARRRENAARVVASLPPGCELQQGHECSTWQFVPVAAPTPAVRQALLDGAERAGIELRTYYDPLHGMPAFQRSARAGELAVTCDLASRIVSLPMAVDLTDAELEAVIATLRDGAGDALHEVTP